MEDFLSRMQEQDRQGMQQMGEYLEMERERNDRYLDAMAERRKKDEESWDRFSSKKDNYYDPSPRRGWEDRTPLIPIIKEEYDPIPKTGWEDRTPIIPSSREIDVTPLIPRLREKEEIEYIPPKMIDLTPSRREKEEIEYIPPPIMIDPTPSRRERDFEDSWIKKEDEKRERIWASIEEGRKEKERTLIPSKEVDWGRREDRNPINVDVPRDEVARVILDYTKTMNGPSTREEKINATLKYLHPITSRTSTNKEEYKSPDSNRYIPAQQNEKGLPSKVEEPKIQKNTNLEGKAMDIQDIKLDIKVKWYRDAEMKYENILKKLNVSQRQNLKYLLDFMKNVYLNAEKELLRAYSDKYGKKDKGEVERGRKFLEKRRTDLERKYPV